MNNRIIFSVDSIKMMKSDRNVFLDVDLKNPAQPIEEEEVIEKPPDPIEPEEEQIFKKKNDLVLTKPEETRKSDRKTNQKREVTPKMKAHLERIRKLAAESKAKKRAEKEANKPKPQASPSVPLSPIPEEPTPMQHQPSKPIQIPQPQQSSVASVKGQAPYQPQVGSQIDYDRIINGLWTKQQQQQQMTQQMNQYREQIRQEERKKAFEESKNLFIQAHQTAKKKQSQNMGLQALRGFTPQHSHPVFKQKQNNNSYNPQPSSNPFDACFN
jgi:hypothetical protein